MMMRRMRIWMMMAALAPLALCGALAWGDTTGVVKLRPVGASVDRSEWESDYAIYILGGASGDLPYWDATSGTMKTRAIGTTGQVLTVTGGLPAWAAATGSGGDGITTDSADARYWLRSETVTSASYASTATYAANGGTGTGSARWTQVTFTSTPSSGTFLLASTASTTSGLPIKYTVGGVNYFGIITSQTANVAFDFAGAPIGGTVTALYVGNREMVSCKDLYIAGAYGDAAGHLLWADMNTTTSWETGSAYLCVIKAIHKSNATVTQPKVNAYINGAAVSTNDSNLGIQPSATGWTTNPATSISTTNYVIRYGGIYDAYCTAAGNTTTSGNDLTLHLEFVLE